MTSPPSAPPSSPQLPQRIVEWFWQGSALETARARDDADQTSFFYEQRARIAAEVGQRSLEPSAPWLSGDASHLACALFAESIGWSLRLSDERPSTPLRKPPDRAELEELSSRQRERLLRAAGDEETLSRVVESLLDRRFETHALTEEERTRVAQELSLVAGALLEVLARRRAAVEGVLLRRAWRVTALGLLVAALIGGALSVREALENKADLAAGKAWTTSSQYDTGCASPEQECGSGKAYFFHTQEERQPWVQFDLGRTERVSKVRVTNRDDCCAERAVPLVIEVSGDGENWKEVARRKDTFEEWTARFSTVSARYVRLKVTRRAMFHLKQVRIFG